MNWSETRKKLIELAARRALRGGTELVSPGVALRAGLASGPAYAGVHRGPDRARSADPTPHRTRAPPAPLAPQDRVGRSARGLSVCVASGKGGTGKSVVGASLATLLSSRGRTLVVDADLGVGNAHILQDVSPPRTLVDVVEGRVSAREARVACPGQVDLLAGGSGVPRMAELSSYEMHLVASGLEELELDYRYVIVDSAAGVSAQTLAFAQACDVTLIVTTPDLTAMTDAYAFLKVLSTRSERRPLLLVNRARDEAQAKEVVERIQRVCERFLGRAPASVGWIPDDPRVGECVNLRGPVTLLAPDAPSSRAIHEAAVEILLELSHRQAGGLGARLLAHVGYAPELHPQPPRRPR